MCPTAEQILDQLIIDPDVYGETYQLGCIASRLTIHSQQQRAFNLVWALKERGNLADNPRICIIGAGFAGLTAAAALKSLNQRVIVCERMKDILHLQRGNSTRFVQPLIYDWPAPRSTFPMALFPYMYWFNGSAGKVVEQVKPQWERVGVSVRHGKTAERIEYNGNRIRVSFKDGSRVNCDILLLAVGYGIEKTVSGHTRLSYWRNDSLSQPIVGYEEVNTFLVTGIGDGGLIETIRLTLKDFKHDQFMRDLIVNNDFIAAANHARGIFAADPDNVNNWMVVNFSNGLLNLVRNQRRRDTRVYLNYSGPLWGDKSSLFQRTAVALMRRVNAVHFLPGRLNQCFPIEDGEMAILDTGSGLTALKVNQAVVRIGARSELTDLIGASTEATLRNRFDAVPDSSFEPINDSGLFVDSFQAFRRETAYRVTFIRRGVQMPLIIQVIHNLRNQWQLSGGVTMFLSANEEIWTLNGGAGAALNVEFRRAGLVSRLTLSSTSKWAFDNALSGFNDFYQEMEIDVDIDPIEPPWETQQLDGPHINLEQIIHGGGIRTLRVTATEPLLEHNMIQAHRLLNADTFLDILRHNWTPAWTESFGWRLTARPTADHNWVMV